MEDNTQTNPTNIWFARRTADNFGRTSSKTLPLVMRPSAKRVPPVRYTDINHLWHSSSDAPAVKGQLLVQAVEGQATLIYYGDGDFYEMCKNNGWKCWAYVNSFLPYK